MGEAYWAGAAGVSGPCPEWGGWSQKERKAEPERVGGSSWESQREGAEPRGLVGGAWPEVEPGSPRKGSEWSLGVWLGLAFLWWRSQRWAGLVWEVSAD